LAAQLVKDAQLKVYAGFGHGMTITQVATINADLLRFISAGGDNPLWWTAEIHQYALAKWNFLTYL